MNVAAHSTPATCDRSGDRTPNRPPELVLPDWLQTCLLPLADRGTEPIAMPPDLKSAAALEAPDKAPDKAPDNNLVCNAFNFAYQLHEGQYRASGEHYIAHPVAVAGILRDFGGDSSMIAAGFLHDVVEDTNVTLEEIEQRFGAEVRSLVEGVTKLGKLHFSSKTERQAENFRRMFLAMAQDIRVIVVKLADRLHNMRTLEHLSSDRQRRIALETREIFAPLANRLGIGHIKWELEDLSFKYLEPEAFQEIKQLVAEKRTDRESQLLNITNTIKARLEQVGIKCVDIHGRPKHLYGIHTKMQKQQKEYAQIFDIAAIRVIVNANDECYRSLAIIHDLFRPIPGRFKDYIGLPKPNRYQSLHTGVISSTGRPLEVQIRTLEMHRVAEYGIAAHWKYKESGSDTPADSAADEKFNWLGQFLDWQTDLKDAQEYLDSIKDNLFDGEVFVFTPQGDVIPLSSNATPVDFAYRIHSEVGNHCAGARVNDRIVTLDTRLKTGDIVEIITQKNSHPSLNWLNFVATAGARNRIRQWYKRSHRDENITRAREMLEKVLGKNGFEALLKSAPMLQAAERCNYQSVDDFLAAVGYGEVTLNHAINRIRDAVKAQQPQTADPLLGLSSPLPTGLSVRAKSDSKSPISGIEGLLHHVAGCCNPIPGEAIIGVVSRGGNRGIAIHRQGCANLDQVDGARLIPIGWNPIGQTTGRAPTYPIEIQIEVIDRVGVLKDILSRLTDHNVNVRNAQVKTFPDQTALIDLGIDIADHAQLERTFANIRKMTDVLNLRRINQVEIVAAP